MKLKTLCSECFISYRFQCVDYEYTLSPLPFRTSKTRAESDLANDEATITCLLSCYQKRSVNKAPNLLRCQLLHCLAIKWHRFCRNRAGVQKSVSESVLYTGVNFRFLNMEPMQRVAHTVHYAPNLT